MIDFTSVPEEFNTYKGSEKKKTLLYNGKKYLVKFPDPIREKNKNISYINNSFSEYVGSHIFQLIGITTQNTILGKYRYNDKDKMVCACEDFTNSEYILYEFENLALSTNPDKKIETELVDILEVIEENKYRLNALKVKEHFWNMFIVDSLIGNTDRHNGNWGFLFNVTTKQIKIAPVYDCGSCLNPMYEDNELLKMSEVEIKNLAMNCYSCIKENGKKIPYMSYLKQMDNSDCNDAIIRIFPSIDIEKINIFIEKIEGISDVRKTFYKRLINIRYEVLKDVYYKCLNICK